MTPLQSVLPRYKELRDFCDRFWDSVFQKYPRQFACGPGCSVCCELRSVNYLEAADIAEYLGAAPPRGAASQGSACPFLADGRCSIYPARPLICRTHGLLLASDEFSGRFAVSCPFNFTSPDDAEDLTSSALDIDTVTTGLAKLNIAFCTLLGDRKKASERIALGDLAGGIIGPSWFER